MGWFAVTQQCRVSTNIRSLWLDFYEFLTISVGVGIQAYSSQAKVGGKTERLDYFTYKIAEGWPNAVWI